MLLGRSSQRSCTHLPPTDISPPRCLSWPMAAASVSSIDWRGRTVSLRMAMAMEQQSGVIKKRAGDEASEDSATETAAVMLLADLLQYAASASPSSLPVQSFPAGHSTSLNFTAPPAATVVFSSSPPTSSHWMQPLPYRPSQPPLFQLHATQLSGDGRTVAALLRRSLPRFALLTHLSLSGCTSEGLTDFCWLRTDSSQSQDPHHHPVDGVDTADGTAQSNGGASSSHSSSHRSSASLPCLQFLSGAFCKHLVSIEGIQAVRHTLQELDLTNTPVSSLEPLRGTFGVLRCVHVDQCKQLLSLCGLEGKPMLEELHIQDSGVRSLLPLAAPTIEGSTASGGAVVAGDGSRNRNRTPFSSVDRLRFLFASSCRSLESLCGLEDAVHLEKLCIGFSPLVASLAPIARCQQLQLLFAPDCPLITTLEGLQNKPTLASLYVYPSLTSIDALGTSLASLAEVDLQGCRMFATINGLTGSRCLRKLILNECSELTSLAPLRDSTCLTFLFIGGCGRLSSLHGLQQKPVLDTVYADNCVLLQSLGPLLQIRQQRDGCDDDGGCGSASSNKDNTNVSTAATHRTNGSGRSPIRSLDIDGCTGLAAAGTALFDELEGMPHLGSFSAPRSVLRGLPATLTERLERNRPPPQPEDDDYCEDG